MDGNSSFFPDIRMKQRLATQKRYSALVLEWVKKSQESTNPHQTDEDFCGSYLQAALGINHHPLLDDIKWSDLKHYAMSQNIGTFSLDKVAESHKLKTVEVFTGIKFIKVTRLERFLSSCMMRLYRICASQTPLDYYKDAARLVDIMNAVFCFTEERFDKFKELQDLYKSSRGPLEDSISDRAVDFIGVTLDDMKLALEVADDSENPSEDAMEVIMSVRRNASNSRTESDFLTIASIKSICSEFGIKPFHVDHTKASEAQIVDAIFSKSPIDIVSGYDFEDIFWQRVLLAMDDDEIKLDKNSALYHLREEWNRRNRDDEMDLEFGLRDMSIQGNHANIFKLRYSPLLEKWIKKSQKRTTPHQTQDDKAAWAVRDLLNLADLSFLDKITWGELRDASQRIAEGGCFYLDALAHYNPKSAPGTLVYTAGKYEITLLRTERLLADLLLKIYRTLITKKRIDRNRDARSLDVVRNAVYYYTAEDWIEFSKSLPNENPEAQDKFHKRNAVKSIQSIGAEFGLTPFLEPYDEAKVDVILTQLFKRPIESITDKYDVVDIFWQLVLLSLDDPNVAFDEATAIYHVKRLYSTGQELTNDAEITVGAKIFGYRFGGPAPPKSNVFNPHDLDHATACVYEQIILQKAEKEISMPEVDWKRYLPSKNIKGDLTKKVKWGSHIVAHFVNNRQTNTTAQLFLAKAIGESDSRDITWQQLFGTLLQDPETMSSEDRIFVMKLQRWANRMVDYSDHPNLDADVLAGFKLDDQKTYDNAIDQAEKFVGEDHHLGGRRPLSVLRPQRFAQKDIETPEDKVVEQLLLMGFENLVVKKGTPLGNVLAKKKVLNLAVMKTEAAYLVSLGKAV